MSEAAKVAETLVLWQVDLWFNFGKPKDKCDWGWCGLYKTNCGDVSGLSQVFKCTEER
jgi:hypothetical protein